VKAIRQPSRREKMPCLIKKLENKSRIKAEVIIEKKESRNEGLNATSKSCDKSAKPALI
jgi:hypothetical protein